MLTNPGRPAPARREGSKPGSFMAEDEWKQTAAIRRALIEELGHEKWSKMTVDECDAAVRAEASRRSGSGG